MQFSQCICLAIVTDVATKQAKAKARQVGNPQAGINFTATSHTIAT